MAAEIRALRAAPPPPPAGLERALVEETSQPTRGTELRRGFRSSGERQSVLDWLGHGLRPGRPGRLQMEYPLVFHRRSLAEHFTVFEADMPRAHCVLQPRTLRIREQGLRAAFLSLVYTDPTARGRGHASHVIRGAVEHARKTGIGLVLLWSDLEPLYARQGFVPAGCETLLALDTSILDRALAEQKRPADEPVVRELEILDARADDWPEIARLRAGRATGVLELVEDLHSLRSIPDLDVRVARRGDRLVGFAMRGKGDDFEEVIHEWAGELEATLLCCRSLIADCEPHRQLFLLSPPDRSDLTWTCRRAGARLIRQPLAWMRVTSIDALVEDLVSIGPGDGLLGIRECEDAALSAPRFHWPDRSERGPLEQQTLLRALFGAVDFAQAARDRRDLGSLLTTELESKLPLPCFVWGMESI